MNKMNFDFNNYRVTVTKHEWGWSDVTDPKDTKYFATLEQAEKYKAQKEKGGKFSCYWKATITEMCVP